MITKAYIKIKKFIKSEGKLFAGSGLLTFTRLGSGLILLKITALIGGNSAVAIYGQAHNIVSMVNGILASGVGEGVIKMTAQNQDDSSKINLIKSSSILLMSICTLFIIFISSIFWTIFIDWANLGNFTWLQITIYIFGALFASFGTLLISLANGLQLLNEVVKINIVSIFASLIITGLFFFLNGDSSIIVIPAIYLGIIGIFQIGILIKKIQLPSNILSRIDFYTINQLAGFMIMAIGSFIMTPVALVTIRGWLIQDYGVDLTGDWESSRKLLELVTALLTAYFAMVLLPKLAKISDLKVLRTEIMNSALAIMILSFASLAFLYIFKNQVYYIIFSADFSFSSELMSSRAIGEFLRGLTWIFSFIMIVKARVKLYLSTSFFYMLILIFSSWFMIDIYGIIGANYAYIVSNSIMLLISLIIFYSINLDSYMEPKL